jgi:alpha-beta hydrolase superfamily lysophospholipase
MIITGAMKEHTLSFDCNGYLLAGTLHLPDEKDPPVVIGSHGLYSSSQSPKQITLGNLCAEAGIAFFRFDHRGCGDSQGDIRKDTTLHLRCVDMLSAVDALKKEGLSCSNLGLFGSSLGGAVCISVARELSARAVVLNAASVKSGRILNDLEISDSSKPKSSILFKKTFRFDLTPILKDLFNVLIFHGDADDVVPVSEARAIHELAGDTKRLVVFEGGDHLMSDPEHQATFAMETIRWFKRYLDKSA